MKMFSFVCVVALFSGLSINAKINSEIDAAFHNQVDDDDDNGVEVQFNRQAIKGHGPVKTVRNLLSGELVLARDSSSRLNYMQYSLFYPLNLGISRDDAHIIPEDYRMCTGIQCYDLRLFAYNNVYSNYFQLPNYIAPDDASDCLMTTGVRTYNMCAYSPASLSNQYYPLFAK